MVKIYGYSDDIVCIEKSRYFEDEIGCFDVAGVRLYLDDGTILFVCYSSGVWRIFIEQEGSAPHRHKVCQETSEDDTRPPPPPSRHRRDCRGASPRAWTRR